MTVRLRIKNGNAELVVSSDGRLPYCVGKAALQGAVVQPSGSVVSPAPGRQAGYAIYRVSHDGPIIAAFDLPVGRSVGIADVTSPAAGIYDIKVYCGDGSDANGFETQYPLDVWAFGFADTRLESFGLVLRTDGGVLAADFTRGTPLFPRGFGDLYASPAGFAIPALSRPVGIGMPVYWASQETPHPGSGLTSDHVEVKTFWRRTGATTLTGIARVVQQFQINTDFPVNDGEDGPGPIFIIEGANLP